MEMELKSTLSWMDMDALRTEAGREYLYSFSNF